MQFSLLPKEAADVEEGWVEGFLLFLLCCVAGRLLDAEGPGAAGS